MICNSLSRKTRACAASKKSASVFADDRFDATTETARQGEAHCHEAGLPILEVHMVGHLLHEGSDSIWSGVRAAGHAVNATAWHRLLAACSAALDCSSLKHRPHPRSDADVFGLSGANFSIKSQIDIPLLHEARRTRDVSSKSSTAGLGAR